MATDKHYFIEQNDDGKFAVRAKGSQRASGLCNTQKQAEALAKKLNPGTNRMWSGYETPSPATAISVDQSDRQIGAACAKQFRSFANLTERR
jgi:Uncharacterized protein conserved in bacteria (DUF2188)